MKIKLCNDCGDFFTESNNRSHRVRCQKCVDRRRKGSRLITTSASVRTFYDAGDRLHYNGGWWKKRGRILTRKEMKRRGLL